MTRRPRSSKKPTEKKPLASRAQEGTGGTLILPHLVRYSDIAALVDYLTKKPLGATQPEIRNVLGSESLDWRKMEAYRLTEFFTINNEVSLSQLGVEFSQTDDNGRGELIWKVLKKVGPYNGILEWAHFQKKDQLDAQGVRLKWSTEYPEIDTSNKQRFDLAPIFFFSMCEGGRLGTLIVGRKGQPTRLELDRTKLEEYVSFQGGSEVPFETTETSPEMGSSAGQPQIQPVAPKTEQGPISIFVSHGKKKGPSAEVEEMLQIMGVKTKMAIREPNLARPVSEKVRHTMKECSAAVFIFTPDEALTDEKGNKVYRPSENVHHELGAASVLYDDKIVVLKERSIKLPSNISGLAHIPFDEENVKATFMDLYKELKGFGLV